MSVHTKEPWFANDDSDCITAESRINKVEICEVATGFNEPFDSEQIANKRRIVACVNACAEIPTEDLEESSMTILEYFEDHYAEKLENLQAQRDSLLVALKAIADPRQVESYGDPKVLRDYAVAAISEAELRKNLVGAV